MDFTKAIAAQAEKLGMKTIQGKPDSSKDVGGNSTKVDAADLGSLLAAAKVDKPLNATLPASRVVKRGAPAIGEDFATGPLDKWSFSGLVNFERCPYFMQLHKVDRIPQESGEAAARGSLIHDGIEDKLRGKREDWPSDKKTKFDHFAVDFAMLQTAFDEGRATLEEDWGCRKDWSPCTWDDPELWGRAKLDAFVREDETSARIIDYKTGQRYGNEMKHKDQGVTYALHAFHRYPDIDHFQIEFWYIDQGTKMVFSYGRPHLSIFLPLWHERAYQMTTDEDLLPMPNANNCMYCSYGCNTNKAGTKQYGNGHCTFDFYKDKEPE